MHEGICRLCNNFGKLTYEHVPPKVVFNKRTRFKSINFIEYVKEHNPLNAKFSGKVEQGGIGYYSLCSKCNSFLGATYVTDYQKYSNSFIEFARKKHLNAFTLTMHDFNALNVLKQILSMFFSINDDNFSLNNRDLAEFILDLSSNELPNRFRVFNYLNTEGQLRNLPMMELRSLSSQATVRGSELAFPPLGHVLTIDFIGKLPYHQEITSFSKCKQGSTIDYDFKIYRLPTYLPFLLDYRDRETINRNIINSKRP